MSELLTHHELNATGVATAADFRRAALDRADREFVEPERIQLPASGLVVIIRRPRAAYFALQGLPLPQSVAARSAGSAERQWSDDEAREMAAKVVDLFSHAFVSPKLSLTPGSDEINPNWLLPEDVNFLFRLLVGEVLSGGRDLGRFHREERPSSPFGEARGAVALPSEPNIKL